jgi:hypothetical protein
MVNRGQLPVIETVSNGGSSSSTCGYDDIDGLTVSGYRCSLACDVPAETARLEHRTFVLGLEQNRNGDKRGLGQKGTRGD